jgi:plasmid stabilization system protein ParE
MRLRVLDEARVETEETAAWYEDKRPGLGEDFLQELEAAYLKIEDHPRRYSRLSVPGLEGREFRRITLRRFPYKAIYEIHNEEIVVLAVAHGHRRPNYWIERAAE